MLTRASIHDIVCNILTNTLHVKPEDVITDGTEMKYLGIDEEGIHCIQIFIVDELYRQFNQVITVLPKISLNSTIYDITNAAVDSIISIFEGRVLNANQKSVKYLAEGDKDKYNSWSWVERMCAKHSAELKKNLYEEA